MAVVADPRIPKEELLVRCIHGLVTRCCALCWLKLQRRYGVIQPGKGARIVKPEDPDEDEILVPDKEPEEDEEDPDEARERRLNDPAEAAFNKPRRSPRATRQPAEEDLIPLELPNLELPEDGEGDEEALKAAIADAARDATASLDIPRPDSRLPPPLGIVLEIPVSMVRTFNGQPRKHFDPVELERLGKSIETFGQRTPATVKWLPDGSYELVDGERRLLALRLKKLPMLRAIRIDIANAEEQFAISAISNFGRVGHTALEIAEALERLTKNGWTPQKLAEAFGKTISWVYQYLSLTKLAPEVRRLLDPKLPDSERLKFSMAIVLAPLPPQLQQKLAQEVLGDSLKGTRALQYIRRRARQEGTRAGAPERSPGEDFQILRSTLGTLDDRLAILLDMEPHQIEAMFVSRDPSVREEVLRKLQDVAMKAIEAKERFSPVREPVQPRG